MPIICLKFAQMCAIGDVFAAVIGDAMGETAPPTYDIPLHIFLQNI